MEVWSQRKPLLGQVDVSVPASNCSEHQIEKKTVHLYSIFYITAFATCFSAGMYLIAAIHKSISYSAIHSFGLVGDRVNTPPQILESYVAQSNVCNI